MALQEKAAATEAYRAKLIDGMNGPLLMDFRESISDMRERALGDRRHYSEWLDFGKKICAVSGALTGIINFQCSAIWGRCHGTDGAVRRLP